MACSSHTLGRGIAVVLRMAPMITRHHSVGRTACHQVVNLIEKHLVLPSLKRTSSQASCLHRMASACQSSEGAARLHRQHLRHAQHCREARPRAHRWASPEQGSDAGRFTVTLEYNTRTLWVGTLHQSESLVSAASAMPRHIILYTCRLVRSSTRLMAKRRAHAGSLGAPAGLRRPRSSSGSTRSRPSRRGSRT